MRTRIKFCGITRAEDAVRAAELGVDALGFIFYPGSPRYIDIPTARSIVNQLPAFVSTVGLFVDASQNEVHEVIKAVPLNLLQFHGSETIAYCESFMLPYIKVVRSKHQTYSREYLEEAYPSAQALVLDTYVPGAQGGTGVSFDWDRIPDELNRPIVLAGGLNPDNIEQAIIKIQPYCVDTCTGIEVDKGVKDYARMKAFIRGVIHADYTKFAQR